MIVVFGSTNLDQIGTVERFPRPGETVAGGTFSTAPGGKGANQALGARRAGAMVRLVSAVGFDSFAEVAMAQLRADGVDISRVAQRHEPTGIAMIFVDALGENVISVLPGANGTVTPQDAENALADLTEGDVLLVQQEIPQASTRRALTLAREKGALSVLNTAPFLEDTRAISQLADIVVANESEFTLLTGRKIEELNEAAEHWVRTTGRTLVVTLGPQGAYARNPEAHFRVPAHPVEPADTVGAGDTFCGYLAAGLGEGLNFRKALERAAIAASLACCKAGAQHAMPWRGLVDRTQSA